MPKYNYTYLGYVDYINKEPYKRAPGSKCPRVPDGELPQEWRDYFDGYFSAGAEKMAQIKRRRIA